MCRDALSRKSRMSAAELLLGHAAEIAGSADGRDQLLSLGLSAGAADIVAGRPPLDAPPSVTLLRGRVLSSGEARRFAESNRAAHDAAVRLTIEIAGDAARFESDPGTLRRSLRAVAALQAALWPAPEIPAGGETRMTMMLSAPLLLEKAGGRRLSAKFNALAARVSRQS